MHILRMIQQCDLHLYKYNITPPCQPQTYTAQKHPFFFFFFFFLEICYVWRWTGRKETTFFCYSIRARMLSNPKLQLVRCEYSLEVLIFYASNLNIYGFCTIYRTKQDLLRLHMGYGNCIGNFTGLQQTLQPLIKTIMNRHLKWIMKIMVSCSPGWALLITTHAFETIHTRLSYLHQVGVYDKETRSS